MTFIECQTILTDLIIQFLKIRIAFLNTRIYSKTQEATILNKIYTDNNIFFKTLIINY